MSDLNLSTPGWPAPAHCTGNVPERYFGVWSRTLLQTPHTRDTSTLVRWMQLGHWHVDLRVPQTASGALQGFCGTTRITQVGTQEMCTWQRLVDYQPPRATSDEGWIVFETADRLREDGVHSVYFEEWERLPGSTGCRMALTEPPRADGKPSTRLFVSGDYMARVRPVDPIGPEFEISFGKYAQGRLQVEASTIASLTGTNIGIALSRVGDDQVNVSMDSVDSQWVILEWVVP